VFCRIYRLYSEAGKLDREAAQSTGREAWLELTRARSGAPEWYARIYEKQNGRELNDLSNARVRFIRDGGLMITGFETIIDTGSTRSISQAWWCVPLSATSDQMLT
jgi:hypothetical protein